MFTGLIEKTGTLKSQKPTAELIEMAFQVDEMWSDIVVGESIAVNGVCLTVTRFKGNVFYVDASKPTLAASNLSTLKSGSRVNLERALKVGDRLGGHWVQGHVDGVACVNNIKKEKGNVFISFTAPQSVVVQMIDKGSVALDGISLTIQVLTKDSFTVVVIPHTFKHTTLADRTKKDMVNIEVDMLSKYVRKHLSTQSIKKTSFSTADLENLGF